MRAHQWSASRWSLHLAYNFSIWSGIFLSEWCMMLSYVKNIENAVNLMYVYTLVCHLPLLLNFTVQFSKKSCSSWTMWNSSCYMTHVQWTMPYGGIFRYDSCRCRRQTYNNHFDLKEQTQIFLRICWVSEFCSNNWAMTITIIYYSCHCEKATSYSLSLSVWQK